MVIVFAADLHLPYRTDAVQYRVFRRMLREAAHADLLVIAGDFTAACDPEAVDAFAREMADYPVPAVILCGNAEHRGTAENLQRALRLQSPIRNEVSGWTILSLQDSDAAIPEEAYDALRQADARTIVVGHHPIASLKKAHRARMEAWRAEHPHIPFFAAHKHKFDDTDPYTTILPACDPDKAIGEEPSIVFYDTDTGAMRRSFYPAPVPADFPRWLGISCPDPAADIPYAASHGIRCVELRANAARADRAVLMALIRDWREKGGEILSLHAPDIRGGTDTDGRWAAFAALAANLGADRITLHPPRRSAAEVRADPTLLSRPARLVGEAVRDLSTVHVIGIENMHMTEADTPENRRFGCLPDEIRAWRDAVAAHTAIPCGLHLDVGHARNNRPYSEKYSLGAWYAEIGSEVVGYHLHQIDRSSGKWENHCPMDNRYGPLISFAGFFDAWSCGQLAKAPLILEIRAPGGYASAADAIMSGKR